MTKEEMIFELDCAMQLALEKGLKHAYEMLKQAKFSLENPGYSYYMPPIKAKEM